jgi:cytidine deaminase
LTQVEGVLEKAPDEVAGGKFQFTEFTVSAEVWAKGGLVLMGTGIEAAGKGGLTFKFVRSAISKDAGESGADLTTSQDC